MQEHPAGLIRSPGQDIPAPPEGVTESRWLRAIRLAILRLPVRYRWLYMAQFRGDYTYKELATAHRVSVRTILRWRQKLVEKVTEEALKVEKRIGGR